jgi:hypothetical protein
MPKYKPRDADSTTGYLLELMSNEEDAYHLADAALISKIRTSFALPGYADYAPEVIPVRGELYAKDYENCPGEIVLPEILN